MGRALISRNGLKKKNRNKRKGEEWKEKGKAKEEKEVWWDEEWREVVKKKKR